MTALDMVFDGDIGNVPEIVGRLPIPVTGEFSPLVLYEAGGFLRVNNEPCASRMAYWKQE